MRHGKLSAGFGGSFISACASGDRGIEGIWLALGTYPDRRAAAAAALKRCLRREWICIRPRSVAARAPLASTRDVRARR